MKKILLLFFAFFSIVSNTLFAQIAQEDINASLSEATLESLDNTTLTVFLQDFSETLIAANWEDLKPFFYQKYYDKYYNQIAEEKGENATENEIQVEFLRYLIATYIRQAQAFGDYMQPFYNISDWTTIEQVFFTESTYYPIPNDDIIDGMWNVEVVFVTADGTYHVGSLKCAINKQTNKGFIFGSEG